MLSGRFCFRMSSETLRNIPQIGKVFRGDVSSRSLRTPYCSGVAVTHSRSVFCFNAPGKLHQSNDRVNSYPLTIDPPRPFSTTIHSLCKSDKSKDKLAEDEHKTEKPPGLIKRFHMAYKEYGKVLVGVHLVTSCVWYGSFLYAVHSGVDITPALEYIGTSPKIIDKINNSGAGSFAIAYLMYKLATPARYTVTLAGTQLTANELRRRGYMAKPDKQDSIGNLLKEGKDKAKDTYDDRKEKIKDRIDDSKEKLKDKYDDSKEKLKDKYDDSKGKLKDRIDDSKGKLKDRLDESKEKFREKKSQYQSKGGAASYSDAKEILTDKAEILKDKAEVLKDKFEKRSDDVADTLKDWKDNLGKSTGKKK